MEAVAAHFGKQVLREVRPEQMMQAIGEIRKTAGERAVLRAMHFYEENRRVKQMIAAVREGNADQILKCMIESGESSWMLLQNVYPAGPLQPMALALKLAAGMLKGRGAWRVHGGGFAGTTLNAVPNGMTDEFVGRMESVFGEKSCFILDVRPEGAAVVFGSEGK